MLDLSDRTRTGISILASAAGLKQLGIIVEKIISKIELAKAFFLYLT